MNCPKCGERLMQPEALGYGCENCQRRYRIMAARLIDIGPWERRKETTKTAGKVVLVALGIVAFWVGWLIGGWVW